MTCGLDCLSMIHVPQPGQGDICVRQDDDR